MNCDPGPVPRALERPKPLVGSYSMLSQYMNCPHAAFHKYIARTYPYEETPAMAEGNAIHLAMENRLRSRQPLPPRYAQWEPFARPFDAHGDSGPDAVVVELKLGIDRDGRPCDYWGGDVWFRGRLDAAIVKGNKAYLVDWKSGSSKYEDPFELEIGAVLLQARFSAGTIRGQYAWLAESRLGTLYDLSDTGRTFARMKHLMEEIGRDRARDWFEKRRSGLCGWCSCTHCENHFVKGRENAKA